MARHRRLATITISVVAIDQAAKATVDLLEVGPRLTPVGNPHTALGIVQGSRSALVVLMAVTLLAFGAFLVHQTGNGLPAWIAGALLGGASSNLIDRVAIGSVRDFIHLPGVIVNPADVFLVVGTIALLACTTRRLRTEEGGT